MELSMRILAGITVEVGSYNFGLAGVWKKDFLQLQALQCGDGGWETGWLCRYGKTGILIGNRGLTTALAIKVLEQTIGTYEDVKVADQKLRIWEHFKKYFGILLNTFLK